jgi:hypothetical protein
MSTTIVSNTARSIVFISPVVAGSMNSMCFAQYSNSQQLLVFSWALVSTTGQPNQVIGLVNTPVGIDYADYVNTFTGYEFVTR